MVKSLTINVYISDPCTLFMQRIDPNNQPYLCRDCKKHMGLLDPEEEKKKNEVKMANMSRGTLCIFGFDHHGWFCICDLVNVDPYSRIRLICDECSRKFRGIYESSLASLKSNGWDGQFEDFLSILMEEKLKYIRDMPLQIFDCNLAKRDLAKCKQKFRTIYGRYMNKLI